MINRIFDVFKAFLILIDEIACFIWLAPLYIVGLADKCTGRQLISSYVGRAAINCMPWALRAEKVINFLIFWQSDHCRRAARHYAGQAD